MKTLGAKSDHILKSLISNGGTICLMWYTEDNHDIKSGTTGEYADLFNPLTLEEKEFLELLEMIKEEKYIEYELLEIPPPSHWESARKANATVWFKDLKTGKIINQNNAFNGYAPIFNSKMVHLGQCQKIRISLKGRVFYENGGYDTKEIREKWKHRLDIAETWAIILGGVFAFLYYLPQVVPMPKLWHLFLSLFSCK